MKKKEFVTNAYTFTITNAHDSRKIVLISFEQCQNNDTVAHYIFNNNNKHECTIYQY